MGFNYEKSYTLDEAAEAASVSRFTLDRDIAAGDVKTVVTPVPNSYPRFSLTHTQLGAYIKKLRARTQKREAEHFEGKAQEHRAAKANEHANLRRRADEMAETYGFD